jgi:hypothetical protein
MGGKLKDLKVFGKGLDKFFALYIAMHQGWSGLSELLISPVALAQG